MSRRISIAAGIVGPAAFVASWVVAGSLRSGYVASTDSISRLAELGAPRRAIVTAGMAAFGLCCLVFAPTFRRYLGAEVRWASIVLVVAGLASLGVATFPCSEGCPAGGEFTDAAHRIAAAVLYVSLTAVPLLAAVALSHRTLRAYRIYSALTAVIAAVALSLQATGFGPNGTLQRVGLTTNDLWLVVTAILVSRRGRFRFSVRP